MLSQAATVLLLRDGDGGYEVFMVKRPAESKGFANALVFPGGRLDDADSRLDLLADHCRRPEGISDADMALRVCAIRETFEEACILLARPRGSEQIIGGERAIQITLQYRKALHSGEISLVEIAEREDLEYACDLLIRFAHWITPEGRPQRFDTHFYLAPAPEEQVAVHDEIELVESTWVSPSRVIVDADAGVWTVLFVTRANLMKLAESGTISEAFVRARAAKIVTVQPLVESVDGGSIFRIPAEAGYQLSEKFEPRSSQN